MPIRAWRRAGAAVAAVDEAELAPEVNTFNGKELYFAGLHIVFCKTLADDGEPASAATKRLIMPMLAIPW